MHDRNSSPLIVPSNAYVLLLRGVLLIHLLSSDILAGLPHTQLGNQAQDKAIEPIYFSVRQIWKLGHL